MTRVRSPFMRLVVHLLLLAWVLYSVLPFGWTLLNSIKLPIDANARTPKIIGFEATSRNYADLWLYVSPEEFAPIGIALLALVAMLVVFALWARRRTASGPIVTLVIVGVLVAAAIILPRITNMAPFYGYFLNSIIVTVGTLAISISIACMGGYALARYSGILGVIILVAALGFRALPRMAFVLPYYYLGQLSGMYDTHLLLILILVAVNQPFAIWMLRSFFMEIPREIEEAAMMDGAGRLQSFLRVIIPITWPGIITTSLFTLLLAYNEFLLARILTQTNAATLPVAIAQYTSGEDASYITLAAAASISISLPIVFVIIFFQKYLVKGLASGAVKG